MSGSYGHKTLDDKYDYLRETYDTLIVRDIEEKYMKYLCEAYAFYKVRRYDIKGK